MELTDIIYLLFAFLMLSFWWKTMQARERAEALAKIACQKENVQLLDGTVGLKKVGFEKLNNKYYFFRYFGFEFSNDRIERRSGVIVMRGIHQEYMVMDLSDSPTISVNEEK